MKTKALYLEKTADPTSRVRSFTASTDSVDADNEIVEQDFILERFMANPVILWAHKSRELPIGKAVSVGVIGGKLKTEIEFATAEANPKAEHVFQSIEQGTLRALSIGFKPKSVRMEMRDEKEVFVLSKNELFEISVTPIPCNHEALADMKAKARKEFRSTTDNAADGGQESKMNEKEFKELQATSARLEKELSESAAKYDTLKKRYDATEQLYTAEKAKAVALQSAACEKRVQELVGKKIAPTEVESLVELAALDQKLFEKHMAAIDARPDMLQLKGSGLPTGDDPGVPKIKDIKVNQDGESDFAAFVNQGAGIQ